MRTRTEMAKRKKKSGTCVRSVYTAFLHPLQESQAVLLTLILSLRVYFCALLNVCVCVCVVCAFLRVYLCVHRSKN
jgi:hypothetical protein